VAAMASSSIEQRPGRSQGATVVVEEGVE
jgi:hypothetical protein